MSTNQTCARHGLPASSKTRPATYAPRCATISSACAPTSMRARSEVPVLQRLPHSGVGCRKWAGSDLRIEIGPLRMLWCRHQPDPEPLAPRITRVAWRARPSGPSTRPAIVFPRGAVRTRSRVMPSSRSTRCSSAPPGTGRESCSGRQPPVQSRTDRPGPRTGSGSETAPRFRASVWLPVALDRRYAARSGSVRHWASPAIVVDHLPTISPASCKTRLPTSKTSPPASGRGNG